MAKLLERLEELFGTRNLYEVLGVKSKVSTCEIKKAYYKVSLQVHPDRVNEEKRETATKQFQSLSQVYAILSNEGKRSLYDECGEIDEDSNILQSERNWDSYWRILFKKITVADIEEFEAQYRFSKEESADVMTAYVECEGDMDLILEKVPCCTVEDDMRFKEIIDKKIKGGEGKLYSSFRKENGKKQCRRRKMAKKEADEAEEAAREIGLGREPNDLEMMIARKRENRAKEMDNFFDHLETKYGNPKKKTKTSSKGKREAK